MKKNTMKEIINGAVVVKPLDTRASGLIVDKNKTLYIVFATVSSPILHYTKVYLCNEDFGKITSSFIISFKELIESKNLIYNKWAEILIEDIDFPPTLSVLNAEQISVSILAMPINNAHILPALIEVGTPEIVDSKYVDTELRKTVFKDISIFTNYFNLKGVDEKLIEKMIDTIVEEVLAIDPEEEIEEEYEKEDLDKKKKENKTGNMYA